MAQAGYIAGMQHKQVDSLEPKRTQFQLIVDVSHSAYNNTRRLFSLQQNNFWLCGQAFTSFQHGLFMSEEMLDFIILFT